MIQPKLFEWVEIHSKYIQLTIAHIFWLPLFSELNCSIQNPSEKGFTLFISNCSLCCFSILMGKRKNWICICICFSSQIAPSVVFQSWWRRGSVEYVFVLGYCICIWTLIISNFSMVIQSWQSRGRIEYVFVFVYVFVVELYHLKLLSLCCISILTEEKENWICMASKGNSSTYQDHQFTGRLNQIVIQPQEEGK